MKLRILLLFFISYSAVAQDAFRKERALRFGMQQDSIYRSAQALAKKRGIPLQQNVGKGRTLTFQGFSEIGEALYLRPESNAQAAKMTKTNLLYPGGSLNIGITGKSDTVKGKLGMWDGGGVLTTHQEFGGRAVAQQTITGTNEHSTHVAGILVAGGVSPSAKGMAYEADLKVWDYSNDNSEISTASTSASGKAYAQAIAIHPLPVHRSRICCGSCAKYALKLSFINSAIGERGTNTRSST